MYNDVAFFRSKIQKKTWISQKIVAIFSHIENRKDRENSFSISGSLCQLKKYYDYDDIKCKGIREVTNLFNRLMKIIKNQ